MEKKIIKKVESYIDTFKEKLQKAVETNNKSELNSLIYYPKLEFTKEDFQKRKRIKNKISDFERCVAKRANNEQCTRRKKNGECFCGTHSKGTPHGILENELQTQTKIEVWVQDIKGINYYIDKNYNVYHPEDILSNSPNPRIISKWKLLNEQYTITEYE